ncbi:hypothetical protein CE91St16_23190 [Alistipes finegoldii]|uniref:Uncharacterized protein n=1 Tax=Alistipes finegoldii TaxID=214856 RepID=A0AA37KW84_9BACT|nr:hypothetical protein CE91St15_33980 [Alistipes finegoldii]GKI19411.1 hypothetical protein CE91St16_23190 [Alistipes finegoldii]
MDFGNLPGSGDAGIDRSLALFVDFGFLAEENDGESDTSAHSYMGLMIKRFAAWNILRRKIVKNKAIHKS